MYRNTMYISTITSWLHSQWHSYIATKKNRIVSLTLIKHFSSRYRTSNKNNTEYRTSVQKLLCYIIQRKLWKETKLRTILHSNRCQCSRHLLKPRFRNNRFWTLLMLPKLQHCIATVFWFQNNHSKSSLTKV